MVFGVIKVLVSACLLGDPVAWDGSHRRCDDQVLNRWRNEGRVISLCPESLSGLTTPRSPAEIVYADGAAVVDGQARVVTQSGLDLTASFLKGASAALQVAQTHDIKMAVLKERSPSCGISTIHAGRFDGSTVAGQGVTAALFHRHGLRVFNEYQWQEAERWIRRAGNSKV